MKSFLTPNVLYWILKYLEAQLYKNIFMIYFIYVIKVLLLLTIYYFFNCKQPWLYYNFQDEWAV